MFVQLDPERPPRHEQIRHVVEDVNSANPATSKATWWLPLGRFQPDTGQRSPHVDSVNRLGVKPRGTWPAPPVEFVSVEDNYYITSIEIHREMNRPIDTPRIPLGDGAGEVPR